MLENTCRWASEGKIKKYHDLEHGRLLKNDQDVFERLVLEIMQPGLSFAIVLSKQDGLKRAFANYNFVELAEFTETNVEELMQDANIIRNRQKIKAVINNAKIVGKIIEKQKLIDFFIDLLDYRLKSTLMVQKAVKELKKVGFQFIGPSVFQSFLESIGLLNGHEEACSLNNQSKIYEITLKTVFGMLDVKYQNFKIIYAQYNDTKQNESYTDDGYGYVIRRQISLYNERKLEQFRLGYQFKATEFQNQVYDVIINSKFGDYLTYKDVAQKINSQAYRAVGSALNKNKIQFFIPCHRVGNKNKIGGFAANEDRKQMMLEYEGVKIPTK